MNTSYLCDFSDDRGRCCNNPPEYVIIDTNQEKMCVCERHLWHLYDPNSGELAYYQNI